MLKYILSRKGQNMAEYAIIFGVVIAAAVGISALIKQGVQSRVVHEIGKIGETTNAGAQANFDITTYTNRVSNPNETINITKGGGVNETRNALSSTVNVTENYNAQ